MKVKQLVFSRLVAVLPFFVFILLIDLSYSDFEIYVSAGFFKYLGGGLAFLLFFLIGGEYVFSKVLKTKITASMSFYFKHLIVPLYLACSFILGILFYQVVAGEYTDFGIWSNGVSKVNVLTHRLSPNQMKKTENDLNKSLEIAGKNFSEEVLIYTQRQKEQLSEFRGPLKEI